MKYMTKQQAIDALNSYFSDTSRSKQETLDGMDDIIDHAESMRQALQEEIDAESRGQ